MKNIRVALLACMVALFAVSCEKEAEEGNESPAFSGDRFKIEIASFRDADNSKAYLNFTNASSNIIYESGDKVQINGRSFTLTYDDGSWWANADNGQPYTGDILYTAYCDGTLNVWDSNAAGGPKYNFNINDYIDNNTHNKIILCGTSSKDGGTAITLRPACAILRVFTGNSGSSWTNVRVGFDGNKIPATGTIKPATQVITPVSYLEGVSQGSGSSINGDFLAMRWSKQSSAPGNHASSESGYWYVAIPIPENSVTTTLYLGWNNGSTDVQFKTQGQVTLQKGYVYTVGTERQTPFTEEGSSKCTFLVSASKKVRFSAGNLQAMSYIGLDDNYHFRWRFAPHQYDVVGGSNGSYIVNEGNYFDLFGYGTSGCNEDQKPNLYSTDNTAYYSNSIAGTNYDWGRFIKYNPGIYYGNVLVTTKKWRTLTSDEWNYVINSRSGKSGYATIGSSYKGIILLPNKREDSQDWTIVNDYPSGIPEFNATLTSYENNTFTIAQWEKLEAAGAIFLPVTGYRNGTSMSNVADRGYYWSTSIGTPSAMGSIRANALQFTGATPTVTNTVVEYGCAVRLVIAIGE